MVLRWCYSGVTVVLQWCYSGVTMVLQWCCSGVTMVLQWFYPVIGPRAPASLHPPWSCEGIRVEGRFELERFGKTVIRVHSRDTLTR
jgi:hypothetical protein